MNGATAFVVVTTTSGTENEVVVLPYTTFVRPLEEGEEEEGRASASQDQD